MNATHAEAPDENSRSAARRLLERLAVFGGPSQPPRRDPVGDTFFRNRLLARADAARAAFVLLLLVILAATTMGPHLGSLGSLYSLIVAGWSCGWARPCCCQRRTYSRTRPTLKSADFAPMAVSGGYNCRGFCWLGPARTEAVWDTGATRNSISKDYLKALLENKATSTVEKELIDIEPLDCSSVKKGVVRAST